MLHHEFQGRDDDSPLVIEGLTLELLAECTRRPCSKPERASPRWLSAVYDLLHARFADHLTLQAVADSIGIHPAHLTRVFPGVHSTKGFRARFSRKDQNEPRRDCQGRTS